MLFLKVMVVRLPRLVKTIAHKLKSFELCSKSTNGRDQVSGLEGLLKTLHRNS